MMKSSAYILNEGRGGIINEKNLAFAIDNDIIAGAATDVLSKEPIEKQNPLMEVKNKHKIINVIHVVRMKSDGLIPFVQTNEQSH